MTENEALLRLQKICSQQERCLFDINRKLTEWKIPASQAKSILEKLLDEKFVDELRYSKSFVRDKFRLNEWGRIKLAYVLRHKKIDDRIIRDALEEIDETEYHESVIELLRKKRKTLKDRDTNVLKAKLIRFAQSKGFEYNIILQSIHRVFKESCQE